jgi:hypothetical protein
MKGDDLGKNVAINKNRRAMLALSASNWFRLINVGHLPSGDNGCRAGAN